MFPALIVGIIKEFTVKFVYTPLVPDIVPLDKFVETKLFIVLVGAYTDPELIVFEDIFVAVKFVNTPLPLDKFVETKFVIVLVGA